MSPMNLNILHLVAATAVSFKDYEVKANESRINFESRIYCMRNPSPLFVFPNFYNLIQS